MASNRNPARQWRDIMPGSPAALRLVDEAARRVGVANIAARLGAPYDGIALEPSAVTLRLEKVEVSLSLVPGFRPVARTGTLLTPPALRRISAANVAAIRWRFKKEATK